MLEFEIVIKFTHEFLNNLTIKNSKEVEILGITLDRNMNLHTHIQNIYRKAGQKNALSSLSRISPIQFNDKISV